MLDLEMRGRTHDGARVVSAQFAVDADLDGMRDSLKKAMETECGWAEENDVIIGHLKAYIKRGDSAIMLSTTGYGVQIKGEPGEGSTLEIGIDSITYGSSLEEAEDRLENLAKDLLSGYELRVNWDCGDANCSNPGHHHSHYPRLKVKSVKKPLKVHPKMVFPGHDE